LTPDSIFLEDKKEEPVHSAQNVDEPMPSHDDNYQENRGGYRNQVNLTAPESSIRLVQFWCILME